MFKSSILKVVAASISGILLLTVMGFLGMVATSDGMAGKDDLQNLQDFLLEKPSDFYSDSEVDVFDLVKLKRLLILNESLENIIFYAESSSEKIDGKVTVNGLFETPTLEYAQIEFKVIPQNNDYYIFTNSDNTPVVFSALSPYIEGEELWKIVYVSHDVYYVFPKNNPDVVLGVIFCKGTDKEKKDYPPGWLDNESEPIHGWDWLVKIFQKLKG